MDIQSDAQCLKETEKELRTSGITFYIQFVGFVVVEKSLNSLTTERQTEVTREFIRLVVQKAGSDKCAKGQNEGQVGEEDIFSYLRGSVHVHNIDVLMNVSTRNIILIDSSSSAVLHRFLIQDVSILSHGSEAEMPSFFCFVAKVAEKDRRIRKCFVFKASDRSILLELRDAICLTFRLSANKTMEGVTVPLSPSSILSEARPIPVRNDLLAQNPEFAISDQQNLSEAHLLSPPEVPPRPKRTMVGKVSADSTLSLSHFQEATFGLEKCRWYHGTMTREEAELLINENGQFLVRKSPNNDEFILVGMNGGEWRHVYLMDNQGKIVTMVGEFKSIPALIDYFYGKRKPLVLEAVELILSRPINR